MVMMVKKKRTTVPVVNRSSSSSCVCVCVVIAYKLASELVSVSHFLSICWAESSSQSSPGFSQSVNFHSRFFSGCCCCWPSNSNCASPLLLCWWKKRKRGREKEEDGLYTTLTLAPWKVCDALDSKFAKKLVFIIIFLKKRGFRAMRKWEIGNFSFLAEGSFFWRQRYFENFQVSRRHLLGNSWTKPTSRPWDGKVFFKSDRNSAQRVVLSTSVWTFHKYINTHRNSTLVFIFLTRV